MTDELSSRPRPGDTASSPMATQHLPSRASGEAGGRRADPTPPGDRPGWLDRRWMRPAILWLAVLFVTGSLASIPLGRVFWPADLVNFFRPHLFLAGLALAAVCLVLAGQRKAGRAWAVLSAAAVAVAAALPLWLVPAVARPGDGEALRIVTFNLFVDNPRTDRLDAFLREAGADLVVAQELTDEAQPVLIAASRLPYTTERNFRSRDRMMVLSRYPILSERVLRVDDPARDPNRHPLRLEIALPGRTVVLYAIHPDTPRTPWQWHQRNLYLDLLAQSVAAEPKGTAVIVAGDWNTPTWSPFFRGTLAAAGLHTTETALIPAPTRISLRGRPIAFVGMPIDHVAVSPDIGLSRLATGPMTGSNHLPVIADLTVPRP